MINLKTSIMKIIDKGDSLNYEEIHYYNDDCMPCNY